MICKIGATFVTNMYISAFGIWVQPAGTHEFNNDCWKCALAGVEGLVNKCLWDKNWNTCEVSILSDCIPTQTNITLSATHLYYQIKSQLQSHLQQDCNQSLEIFEAPIMSELRWHYSHTVECEVLLVTKQPIWWSNHSRHGPVGTVSTSWERDGAIPKMLLFWVVIAISKSTRNSVLLKMSLSSASKTHVNVRVNFSTIDRKKFTDGLTDYGRDFKRISESMGDKTEEDVSTVCIRNNYS